MAEIGYWGRMLLGVSITGIFVATLSFLLFWLDQTFWVLAQVFVKLAITTLLSRILGSMSGIRATTVGLIIFTIAWGVSSFFAVVFQCWPVQHFWIQGEDGTCISGQNALYTAIGSLSLAEDVALLILPTVVIWRLRLIARLKIQLTILFSVGTLLVLAFVPWLGTCH
ncbi:hypothetical protein N7522_002939 [Penicillium canescens]|nr:hypothetical protein N7522_002939 [Penicillium canescens]